MTADGASSSLRVDPLDCDPRIVELIDPLKSCVRYFSSSAACTMG